MSKVKLFYYVKEHLEEGESYNMLDWYRVFKRDIENLSSEIENINSE